MNSNLSVDADSICMAKSMLASQSFVPLSPASRDESGHVCLCAAGILASAGLQVHVSSREALDFGAELAETGNKDLLFRAFEQLGWPGTLCLDMVDRNDASAPEQRREVVRSLLQSLS